MDTNNDITPNSTTEDKIKEAARRVFIRKGYAATRTRDIAEESGFNLSLINYYFRSKEKLFDIIIKEHFQSFIQGVMSIVNNRETSIRQKIQLIINNYIDMLIKNPDLPLFVLKEINSDPEKFMAMIGFDKLNGGGTYLAQQWAEMAAQRKTPPIKPIHFLMNTASLIIFPFIAGPIIRNKTGVGNEQYNILMEERKQLIPYWINLMLTDNYDLLNQ